MKLKNSLIVCLTLLFQTTLLAVEPQQYLEEFTRGAYRPHTIGQITHLPDGEHYAMISDDRTQIIEYEYTTGKQSSVLFDVNTAKGEKIKSVAGYTMSSDGQKMLLFTSTKPIYRRSFTAAYYIYNIKRNELQPLSEENNRMSAALFSPNGRIVAFARDNNLFLKKLDYNTELQITDDGKTNSIINGTADWVYEEEFAQTRYFEWSADSKMLAYVRFDESNVQQYSFQRYDYDLPQTISFKYPRAGEMNSRVELRVYDVANRTTKTMNFGGDNDIYIPQICWTNDANTLTAVKLNRNQNVLELIAFNARSGVNRHLLKETSNTYVDYQNLRCLQFLSDNSFVCLSERDGWRHAYLFDANGIKKHQITSGEYDITDFYGYDEANKLAYFQAAKLSPITRQVLCADSKGKLTELDKRVGCQSAQFSSTYKYAIWQFNNTTTPNTYAVMNAKGKQLCTLADNTNLQNKIAAQDLPQKEFFTFKTSENIELNGWIVKPKDTKSGDKLPLVMVQYSGPNSQEVVDRWSMDWEYYLAMQGYVVACVDGRGTGARGNEFRTCTYQQLGELETKDQLETAHYLGQLDFVDASRIAIWGWSYGGFMTLNCLTSGNGTFKAGIAIAPVVDWRFYDSAYTERFMKRPQENDRGYDATNLIEKAGQLQGNLLLVHATADDNVHTQHTWQYISALVKNGIQFEMQIYPDKNHSLLGAETRLHLYTRCTNFLKANL